ncbi:MAG: DUF302 domain-containing protein [Aquificae bacterium]|nr:DUF302 domain-containing protein [Aquificota bacterium]
MEWSTEDENDMEYKPPKQTVVVKEEKRLKMQEKSRGYQEKPVEEEEEEIPDIYEVVVNIKDFQELDMLLRSELEEANFKIIKVSHVTDGMKEQGRKDFWENMNIYLICRLSDGYFILKRNPHLVGFCPYRVYTYRNKEGFLVVGFVKPSIAIRYMGVIDLKAIKLLKKHDLELKKILDSLNN